MRIFFVVSFLLALFSIPLFNVAHAANPTCTTLVSKGNHATKLDIVFVPWGYTENMMLSFKDDVDKLSTLGLLRYKPFSDHLSSINLYRVDSSFELSEPGYESAQELGKLCNADQIIVIKNDNDYTGGGGSGSGNESGVAYVGRKLTLENPGIVAHELGHSLGNLSDEYPIPEVYNGHQNQPPNNPNCSSSENAPWKGMAGTKVVKGCKFENFYRSSEKSLMYDSYQTRADAFDPWNIKLMTEAMSKYDSSIKTSLSPSPSTGATSPSPQTKNGCQALGSNFVCGSQSKSELAGQSCEYTTKSKAQDTACQSQNKNNYCYECQVDSNDKIKNVCDNAIKSTNKNNYIKYVESRCGKGLAGKYNEAKAKKGEFEKKYYDVYKCGDEEVEIAVASGNDNVCGKAPWDLTKVTGSPTPYQNECLSDGFHQCSGTSTCNDYPDSSEYTPGNQACIETYSDKQFCCKKKSTTPTPKKTNTPTPSTSTTPGAGGANCSNPKALENMCIPKTGDLCINGRYGDWIGTGEHCGGRYCENTKKFETKEEDCLGVTPTPSTKVTPASKSPTPKIATPDKEIVCKDETPNPVGQTIKGLAVAEQDRNCTNAKVADSSSRCCKSTLQCINKLGDGATCRVLQEIKGGGSVGWGNCSTLPLCDN